MEGFREVWAADFEFHAPPGHNPNPICLVTRELISGRTVRLGPDELRRLSSPPYSIGPDALFVAYYASAELGCHLALGWPIPTNVLDLYAEFRNLTNGLPPQCGNGLLGALAHFGLGGIEALEKREMRELAMRGGPYTGAEQAALLAYCETDVDALAGLYPRMLPAIDLSRALLRGRYMAAAASIERNGIPLDVEMLASLKGNWERIQERLIAGIDKGFGVYEGRSFKTGRFERWLSAQGIAWPRLASGRLDLTDDAFKEIARRHPQLAALRELRHALSEMRLNDLAVGPDGRNRTLLSAFQSRTGRNQPSNSKAIFGPAVWLRGLIKPAQGMALAYVDWSQQEFGIAAALSGDTLMQEAYSSGDPYLEFAKQAGAVPQDATKVSHGAARERFKACVLAVQYGMEADSLALRIGQPRAYAAELLRLHRETYRRFWAWSDRVLDCAMLTGKLSTAYGWTIRLGETTNPRSLRNFPMQANGAEMLRLACILGTEAGIKICAPVHDAILIESSADRIEEEVRETQTAMERASEIVLAGFKLRSDAKIVRYPDRYMDGRGKAMWREIQRLMQPESVSCARPNLPYGAAPYASRARPNLPYGAAPYLPHDASPVQSP
jgi:DNA polymerase I